MIRQAEHNQSDSQVSEFQKSMLNKLDSLCSPSPTFESVDSHASSLFDSTSDSSKLRRRRLYHSPGAIGALQSPGVDPGAAALAARDAQRKSIGNILAERARLVQRTLTRNALASQQSSTPVRPVPTTRVSTGNAKGQKAGAAPRNVSAPVRLAAGIKNSVEGEQVPESENMILNSLTVFESTEADLCLRDPVGETSDPHRSECCSGTQRTASESMIAGESSSQNASKRMRRESVPHPEDSLSLTAFSTRRNRTDCNVQWFTLVCSSIKRLVEYVPLSSENLSRCICLQLALTATKTVTLDDSNWLAEFVQGIASLVEAAGECSCHKRSVRAALRKKTPKPSKKKGQSFLDEENMKKVVGWLQDSRALLMERLARNIQLLL